MWFIVASWGWTTMFSIAEIIKRLAHSFFHASHKSDSIQHCMINIEKVVSSFEALGQL